MTIIIGRLTGHLNQRQIVLDIKIVRFLRTTSSPNEHVVTCALELTWHVPWIHLYKKLFKVWLKTKVFCNFKEILITFPEPQIVPSIAPTPTSKLQVVSLAVLTWQTNVTKGIWLCIDRQVTTNNQERFHQIEFPPHSTQVQSNTSLESKQHFEPSININK